MSKNILVISSSLSAVRARQVIKWRKSACAAKKLIFALAVWRASKAATAC